MRQRVWGPEGGAVSAGQLKQEISDRQVQIEQVRDRLRVDMVDEILFDSGEAALKPAGVAVIRKVGAVLKRAGDRRIEILLGPPVRAGSAEGP